jgi:predicted Zn-dependent protease
VVSVTQLVNTKQMLETALMQVEEGRFIDALPLFSQLLEREPRSARLRSYFGLCLAVAEKRFEDGFEQCHAAAKQEFFNPELYLNLARLHLTFGFKAEGVRFIRRGLMIDPSNEALRRAQRDLGARVEPVLSFLPRRHPINRLLGRVRARLFRWSGGMAFAA